MYSDYIHKRTPFAKQEYFFVLKQNPRSSFLRGFLMLPFQGFVMQRYFRIISPQQNYPKDLHLPFSG